MPSALNQPTSQVTVLAMPSLVGRMRCITCIAFGSLHVLLARLTISPCTFLCADIQLTHLSKCCFAPLGCFLVCTPAPRLIVLLVRSLDCHAFSEVSCSSLDLQIQVRLTVTTRSSPQQELQRCVVPDTNVRLMFQTRLRHSSAAISSGELLIISRACPRTSSRERNAVANSLHHYISGEFRTLS